MPLHTSALDRQDEEIPVKAWMISLVGILAVVFSVACGGDSDDDDTPPAGGPGTGGSTTGTVVDASTTCLTKSFATGVPQWISDNFDCVQVTVSGSNLLLTTNDVPNHNSAYFSSTDSRYEAVPSGNTANPNAISAQNYQMTVPGTPAVAAAATDTAMDAIGIATNGVVFYNNEAAPGDSLEAEVSSFDNYNGHPTNTGSYHYHIEPTYLTNDGADLIGVLMDGFAVFGRKCPSTSTYPTDLDTNNGHTADTGVTGLGSIYHYHVADLTGTADDGIAIPVITGSYAGTPGSFTNN